MQGSITTLYLGPAVVRVDPTISTFQRCVDKMEPQFAKIHLLTQIGTEFT